MKTAWHDASVDALVWVEDYQVQDFGFTVDQHVTWPISRQLNAAALTELVGAVTAAHVSMAVDWHARRPEDTVSHTGTVSHIESYRCRHARGRVVHGTVVTQSVSSADFGGTDDDNLDVGEGVDFVGYLVTLTNLRQTPGG